MTALLTVALLAGACSDDETVPAETGGAPGSSAGAAGSAGAAAGSAGASSGSAGASAGSAGTAAGSAGSAGATTVDCTGATTHIDKVVCASNAFLATLTDAEKTTVQYAWTDEVAKTRWSNLPGVTRNGLKFGNLSAASLAAAKAIANAVLTDAGYADFTGVLAADDYLGSLSGGGMGTGGAAGAGGPGASGTAGGNAMGGPGGGGGPPGAGGGPPGAGGGPPGGGTAGGGQNGGGGSAYSSSNYMIAFIGVPSATGDWMLQIGGHHMAYNLTYLAGVGYPTPNHIGAEPKGSFTINGSTYAPVDDEGAAFFALFKSLDSTQLAAAYLKGQTFADVLVGPDEYATGSYPTDSYPAGANRTGVLVSSLSADQQALVKTAMEPWVNDFDPAIAEPLLTAYTTSDAYADTYLAWGGTQASGVDPDVNGTYLRIDGPRAWVELSAQAGVVIQGKSHFHTIYRDKSFDYGHSL